MLKVVTYAGSGLDIVRDVLKDLGACLVVVREYSQALRESFQALLLLGGADITPFFYGQASYNGQLYDKTRDVTEWTLVRRAMDARLPIMGICRGHQMLAIAHGAALWQDIGHDLKIAHPRRHAICGVSSPLAAHIPAQEVNSLHHQAVKHAPLGMSAAARSPDGILEAIWRPGALGVQWHPEYLIAEGDTRWISLFRWFTQGLC